MKDIIGIHDKCTLIRARMCVLRLVCICQKHTTERNLYVSTQGSMDLFTVWQGPNPVLRIAHKWRTYGTSLVPTSRMLHHLVT